MVGIAQRLGETGRRPDGSLALRGSLTGWECERTEVVLDEQTFIPMRIDRSYLTPSGAGTCSSGSPVRQREIQTVTDHRYLPATQDNRDLLRVGPWPTSRTGRETITTEPAPGGKAVIPRISFEPMKLPTVPPLDEG